MEQAMVPISVTVLSSLVSGLVTLAISTWLYWRHESRKQKFEVLRHLAASRYAIAGVADHDASARFFGGLNEAFVIFHDSREVLVALNDFHKHPGRARDNTLELFKAMCNDRLLSRKCHGSGRAAQQW